MGTSMAMLRTLANMEIHPESVPVNALKVKEHHWKIIQKWIYMGNGRMIIQPSISMPLQNFYGAYGADVSK